MADKEDLVLTDKQIIPTDEYIFSIIGDKKILWQNLMNYVSENYKDISGSWNYYNDGKQWLFKLVQKKKTIFWAAILKDTFICLSRLKMISKKLKNMVQSGPSQ